MVGEGASAGHVKSSNVASSGPSTILMQPGSLSIRPWTGSSMTGDPYGASSGQICA